MNVKVQVVTLYVPEVVHCAVYVWLFKCPEGKEWLIVNYKCLVSCTRFSCIRWSTQRRLRSCLPWAVWLAALPCAGLEKVRSLTTNCLTDVLPVVMLSDSHALFIPIYYSRAVELGPVLELIVSRGLWCTSDILSLYCCVYRQLARMAWDRLLCCLLHTFHRVKYRNRCLDRFTSTVAR